MPFNYIEFDSKCATATEAELQNQWENYTRQISGGSTSTAVSILAAPLTIGVSLVGLVLSTPRIHNARKKREIIEKHLQALGSTHHTRKRDVFGPMALSGGIGLLSLGIAPPGAESIVEVGVTNGICAIVANQAAVEAVAHVAVDGVGAGVEELEHKRKEKKERKKLNRDQAAMLRQFQRWKAEEDRIRIEKEKVEVVEEKELEMSTGSPPPTYVEARDLSVKDQEEKIPVAAVTEQTSEESSDEEEAEEDEMSFEDFAEMKKLWMMRKGGKTSQRWLFL
jgi:hypothetical protein